MKKYDATWINIKKLFWKQQAKLYKISMSSFILSIIWNLYYSYMRNNLTIFYNYNTLYAAIILLYGWASETLSKMFFIQMISYCLLFISLLVYFIDTIHDNILNQNSIGFICEFCFMACAVKLHDSTIYDNKNEIVKVEIKIIK